MGSSEVCSSRCQSESISLDKTGSGGPAGPCVLPRAHLSSLQLHSTGSTRCRSTLGLSAYKRLSALATVATSPHSSEIILLLALLKSLQSGISCADRRSLFWNNCIPTKAFVGNFLQAHSQCWHDEPAHCGLANHSNNNDKEPHFQRKETSALLPSCS